MQVETGTLNSLWTIRHVTWHNVSCGISESLQADKVCPPVKRDLDNLGHYQS